MWPSTTTFRSGFSSKTLARLFNACIPCADTSQLPEANSSLSAIETYTLPSFTFTSNPLSAKPTKAFCTEARRFSSSRCLASSSSFIANSLCAIDDSCSSSSRCCAIIACSFAFTACSFSFNSRVRCSSMLFTFDRSRFLPVSCCKKFSIVVS